MSYLKSNQIKFFLFFPELKIAKIFLIALVLPSLLHSLGLDDKVEVADAIPFELDPSSPHRSRFVFRLLNYKKPVTIINRLS